MKFDSNIQSPYYSQLNKLKLISFLIKIVDCRDKFKWLKYLYCMYIMHKKLN